mmetsp:Transcript_68533/g.135458  ORF Transcript_68533/g.135458 Transcript_68533/m.135458 type:complete len:280 (+) Transcript_68533:158-997(+)
MWSVPLVDLPLDAVWPICNALPAITLVRFQVVAPTIRKIVATLWPRLRAVRGRTLRPNPNDCLKRLHNYEAAILYEEFGDTTWADRWLPDMIANRNVTAQWHAGPDASGLELRGLGGRLLDLGSESQPGEVTFKLSARASPVTAAALGYIVLSDASKRPCAWVYIEWQRDVVGLGTVACWVNDTEVRLQDWPWGDSMLTVAFGIDWHSHELTGITIEGSAAAVGFADFHNASCQGVRHIALASLRGESAEVCWQNISLFPRAPDNCDRCDCRQHLSLML